MLSLFDSAQLSTLPLPEQNYFWIFLRVASEGSAAGRLVMGSVAEHQLAHTVSSLQKSKIEVHGLDRMAPRHHPPPGSYRDCSDALSYWMYYFT